ncbi:hypothetical protein ACFYTS_27265 [Nocardia sp. NPDC004151]|uniref:hypothetical protein n=1 Tax=Nocardia sp. NPDC004151 TaxID=3364304 RepID=UPI0036BFD3E7
MPITAKPMEGERPFLGGSPEQIDEDLAALAGRGIDHVIFTNTAPVDLEEELDLLRQPAATVR